MRVRIVLLYMIVWSSLGFSTDSAIWSRNAYGIYESDIRSIMIDQSNNDNIYVGTSKALYRSLDRGKNYQVLLMPSGKQNGVNDIYMTMDEKKTIYAATDSGLYETKNNGDAWDRIYYSSDADSQRCLSVIRYNHTIYVGTQKGLFTKKEQEANWRRSKGDFRNKAVYHLDQDDHYLYGANGHALYSLDKKTNKVRKIFSIGIRKTLNNGSGEDQNSAIGESRFIKYIAITSQSENTISVATSEGIYFSSNRGRQWKRLPTNNLPVEGLTSLLIMSNKKNGEENCLDSPLGCLKILAGTNKGVFFLKDERWIPLYKGMETNKISYLANDERGTVYAATGRGIYALSPKEALPNSTDIENQNSVRLETDLLRQFGSHHEPSINEVHQLAIDYAEVNSEKIKNWRTLARAKAFLPDVSVGLDRNASDLFHWDTGAKPDALQRGRDYIDWDVSLSWDLADLIWSTDQTTIDSRSKLMVELREDILDEVTRLYFERKRIQLELTKAGMLDHQVKIDKEMRIAELTALIDALTGGEFSKRIY